jgi:diguanylate cyclase
MITGGSMPMSKEDALRRIPLLASLGRTELDQLAAMTEELTVGAGTVVCREGVMAREFFLIAEGEAEVTKGGELVRRLRSGEFFGEISLSEHRPRAVTITALTPLRLHVVSSSAVWSMLQRRGDRSAYGSTMPAQAAVRPIAYGTIRPVTPTAPRHPAGAAEQQALHDPLTGLPNRTLLCDRIEQSILASRRTGGGIAVLVVGLDRLKEVGDGLGHQAADALMVELGVRLQGLLRETDTVARIGGHAFGVLLPGQKDAAAGLRPVIDRIGQATDQPFLVEGLALEVEGAIGVSLYPDHGDDVAALLHRADVAMQQARDAGVTYAVYEATSDGSSLERLPLVGDLRQALEDRQLSLHYQPVAELDSRRTTSVEALLRWTHPELGPVPPSEFVPLAEQAGLIKHVTNFVLDEALRQCRTWQDEGIDVGVSVNVSMRSFLDVRFPNEVAALLRQHGVDPSRLELEITESTMLADPFRVKLVLSSLGEMGIRLSIDNFGTGFSSLAQLKGLPVNEIKIDRSFVTNMLTNEEDAVIVRSTIDLARNLGLNVGAEGVETEATWERLRELGCHTAQGYYLSRPADAEAITAWLRSRSTAGNAPARIPAA